MSDAVTVKVDVPRAPTRFVFVLLDSFTLLSFAGALECLRIANRMAGAELYAWALTGDTDDVVICSNSVRFHVDFPL
ncbi:MAG: GlxA family transcriptional regulator, partial [Roseovarius sp.]